MAENNSEQEQYLERVENPSPMDILCGKDKNCVHAPGSIRFRKIIESYRERYANCLTKFDKMLITKEIYETLSQSSRFLKYNAKEKVWEEISPMAARDKCGHALRFANRLKTKASKKKGSVGEQFSAQVVAAPTSATGAAAAVASLPKAVSPTGVPTVTAATTTAPATVPASVSPTAAAASLAQQVLQPAPAPGISQQSLLGELAMRYNSMWNATQIPSLRTPLGAPIAAPAPSVLGTSNAITALAAAAAVRSNPSLLATLANATAASPAPMPALTGTNTAASASATAAAAANALRNHPLLTAITAASAASPVAPAPAPVPRQRRKPTLDDLCSVIRLAETPVSAAAQVKAPAGN